MLQFSSLAVILETLLGEEKKKAQTYTVTLTPGCVEKLSSFAAPDKQRKEKRKKKKINLHHLFSFSEQLKGKSARKEKNNTSQTLPVELKGRLWKKKKIKLNR